MFLLWLAPRAHGALLEPTPRNAWDATLPQFRGRRSLCGVGAMSGQACLWFSQGCVIGCVACSGDGIEPHGLPQRNATNGCKGGNTAGGGTAQPTLPKRLWTMNRRAVEDSPSDVFRFHPWRAPGSAPVEDACGMSGGTTAANAGPGEAVFSPESVGGSTVIAQGDLGAAVLPAGPETAVWTAGGRAEVRWGIRFNHGGGYQYRLCPWAEPLTEACFQRTTLEFVRGSQALELPNGTRLPVPDPQYVDEGVIPVGRSWARNPVPFIAVPPPPPRSAPAPGPPLSRRQADSAACRATSPAVHPANRTDGDGMLCRQFDPICGAGEGWRTVPHGVGDWDVQGPCAGNFIGGAIVDTLQVPATLPPGRYVLGWRWDAEQTTQVWQNCADVRIRSAQSASK